MMEPLNDNFERQINRALDDALSADERLQLDRELIRRPDLRGMMESSRRIDAVAGDALRGLLGDQSGPCLTLPVEPAQVERRKFHAGWWLMPAAAAAAVLAAFLLIDPSARTQDSMAVRTAAESNNTPVIGESQPFAAPREGLTPVNYQPARIDRQLGRNVFGVLGADGNLYLIETDHSRTLKQPGGSGAVPYAGGDL